MYLLESEELCVSVLDPVADRARLGSRYCAGGYVWQVDDVAHGPLLTGPVYPQEPLPFDGQGLPDSFEIALGAEDATVGDVVCVIGAGLVPRVSPTEPFQARHNPDVSEPCAWEVVQKPGVITMTTQQNFCHWALTLTREVALAGSLLVTRSVLANTGTASLPIRWFAHPFFPPTPDGHFCRFSRPVVLPISEAYYAEDDGWIIRQPGFDWPSRTGYQALEMEWGSPIAVEQAHPTLGTVHVACNFPVASLPIWGNECTMSFEPYLDASVAPGETLVWAMRYAF